MQGPPSKVLSADFFVAGDFFTDAENRYSEAVARRDAIRDAWEAEDSPLLASGSTGQLVEHPYVKMLRDHDLLVDRLGAAFRNPTAFRLGVEAESRLRSEAAAWQVAHEAVASWDGPIPGHGTVRIVVAGAPPPTRPPTHVSTTSK